MKLSFFIQKNNELPSDELKKKKKKKNYMKFRQNNKKLIIEREKKENRFKPAAVTQKKWNTNIFFIFI